MIAGAKILTATTTTESLINAFGKILKPLERLGVPVNEFFSTMGLSIRSLPRIKDQIGENVQGEDGERRYKRFLGPYQSDLAVPDTSVYEKHSSTRAIF